MSLAARPLELSVDDTGRLQNLHESIVGTVDVADCDDALDAVDGTIGSGRYTVRPRQRGDGRDESGHDCERGPMSHMRKSIRVGGRVRLRPRLDMLQM